MTDLQAVYIVLAGCSITSDKLRPFWTITGILVTFAAAASATL